MERSLLFIKAYENCASRMEQRGWHPPRAASVDALIEGVMAAGIEAVVHSAVSQAGQSLFPSTVFPHCHPEASWESFHYLIEQLHRIGRPVLSWYPLNHSASVIQAHPDWRMLPIAGDELPPRDAKDHDYYVCINSPYRELLPEFCREIVRDVGFDGLMFDGSAFAVSGNNLPGCVCEFCRRRFRDDTGRVLPARTDWHSHDFKVWVNWRYERLMGFWKSLADAILSISPRATVAFNNYRRRGRDCGGGWGTGIPLRELGWDVLLSGELDLQVLQGDFQMKMHRAARCARGQDTWLALCDHWNLWTPDVELLPIRQAAVASASAGGVLWMGSGFEPRLVPHVCATAQAATAPLMPYIKDPPLPYAAIWVSQQTQDFYGCAQPGDIWDAWHGANELCQHAHVQSAIIFDDQILKPEILQQYPVLLAGNAACVSAEQATHLRRYVENGGVLIACHEFATRDEWGQPHSRPVLDDLLGIRERVPGTGTATLELLAPDLIEACGRWVSTAWTPHTLAVPADQVELLAQVVDHGLESWDNVEKQEQPKPRLPGLWRAPYGKGQVLYMGTDLFRAHLKATTTFQVRLFAAVLARMAPPPVRLSAPMQVTMNIAVRLNGSWAVHLHNAPGTIWRYQTYFNSGELVPVHDLRLTFRGLVVREARSGLTGKSFAINSEGTTLTVPVLECNEVVLVAFR